MDLSSPRRSISATAVAELEDFPAARASFERVLQQDSTHVDAIINLATIDYYEQAYDQSIWRLNELIDSGIEDFSTSFPWMEVKAGRVKSRISVV